jgi:hypothetical protein
MRTRIIFPPIEAKMQTYITTVCCQPPAVASDHKGGSHSLSLSPAVGWRRRGEASVGAQHEDAVVPGFLGQLAGIDREGGSVRSIRVAHPAQVAPVGGVADQRLVAFPELLLQAFDDRLTVGTVLLHLGLVAADDVAGAVHLDLFHEQLGSRRGRVRSRAA